MDVVSQNLLNVRETPMVHNTGVVNAAIHIYSHRLANLAAQAIVKYDNGRILKNFHSFLFSSSIVFFYPSLVAQRELLFAEIFQVCNF